MPTSKESSENIAEQQSVLFRIICNDLKTKSYSVQQNALPVALIKLLSERINCGDGPDYTSAGVGRSTSHHINQGIRSDQTAWIDDDTPTDLKWNKWTETLRKALNRQLFMGLMPIESHYARYQKNGFYKKHIDAFEGIDNRKVSIVLFLNDFWKTTDKGELMLYVGAQHNEKLLIQPKLGTLVVFLSTEIPHEVLPTNSIRSSIAGWYR